MDAVRTKPYQAVEALQRKPLSRGERTESARAAEAARQKDSADSRRAEEAQIKARAEAPRPTTNAQGEQLGQVINATA